MDNNFTGHWRKATPEDLSQMLDLWEEQQRQYAKIAPEVTARLPQIFDPECTPEKPWYPFKMPVVLCNVFERNGRVETFRLAEVVAEFQIVGDDKEAMDTLGVELVNDGHWLKQVVGLTSGWGLVPKSLTKILARTLRHSPWKHWDGLDIIGNLFSNLGD